MTKGNRTANRGHKPKEFDRVVRFRCTDELADDIESAADQEGVESSEWIREQLSAAVRAAHGRR